MPRAKRKRTYGKRKRTFKKKRTYKNKKFGQRNLILGGFPKSKIVKLRYVTEVVLDAATGVNAVHAFRANSLFDPDYTGIGHQPSNFDRWANIYDHYTVLGSKITVRYTPHATASTTPGYLGIALTDSGTVTSTVNALNLLERKLVNSRYRAIGINENQHGFKPLTHTFSAQKFFGKSKGSLINDGQYRGKMGNGGTNPGELAFFEIFAASMHGNNPGQLPLLITIDFIAVLNEPKPDDAS